MPTSNIYIMMGGGNLDYKDLEYIDAYSRHMSGTGLFSAETINYLSGVSTENIATVNDAVRVANEQGTEVLQRVLEELVTNAQDLYHESRAFTGTTLRAVKAYARAVAEEMELDLDKFPDPGQPITPSEIFRSKFSEIFRSKFKDDGRTGGQGL